MSETETEQIPITPPQTPQPPQAAGGEFERCEQCNAPVDHDQRYCVNCGNHRRHVPDPAAKYMSRVSAQTGPSTALVAATPASLVRASNGVGPLALVALALVPVAAAIGVAIGRSSNNHDTQLIKALQNQHAQVTTTYSSSATGSSASSSSSGSTTSTSKKSTKAKKSSTSKAKTASSSSSSNGSAAKITGSKVTSSEQAQGSAEAKKIQSSTGKSYVQGASSLPSTVVVGQ